MPLDARGARDAAKRRAHIVCLPRPCGRSSRSPPHGVPRPAIFGRRHRLFLLRRTRQGGTPWVLRRAADQGPLVAIPTASGGPCVSVRLRPRGGPALLRTPCVKVLSGPAANGVDLRLHAVRYAALRRTPIESRGTDGPEPPPQWEATGWRWELNPAGSRGREKFNVREWEAISSVYRTIIGVPAP